MLLGIRMSHKLNCSHDYSTHKFHFFVKRERGKENNFSFNLARWFFFLLAVSAYGANKVLNFNATAVF